MSRPYFSRSGHVVLGELCLSQAGGKLLPLRVAESPRRGAGAVPVRHRRWRALVNLCRMLDTEELREC